MPTNLERHTITETPDVRGWLDDAARLWPEDALNRTRLVKRLLAAGHREVVSKVDTAVQRRIALIAQASGSMPGVWTPGWYEQYKQEWPQ